MAGLFQVLWGKTDGTFKAAEALKGTDDKPLLIPLGKGEQGWIDGICTRPTALDWDGDGNLDLISGNFTGTFFLFKMRELAFKVLLAEENFFLQMLELELRCGGFLLDTSLGLVPRGLRRRPALASAERPAAPERAPPAR